MSIDETQSMANALMAEIVDFTGICNSTVPASEASFWSELAIFLSITPVDNPSRNARAILEHLGQPWDEDFIEADGEMPTYGALEAVHQAITQQRVRDPALIADSSSEPEEEEDDTGFDELGDVNVSDSGWSLSTVVDWIRQGRLILNPEWQRSFVWKPRKQQALIESILYGLPVPSFLIYKDSTGKFFVIDGRQRLETINRFTSPPEAAGERRLRFKTFNARQEGWRPGEHLNRAANKYYQNLPDDFKAKFDTQTLRVAILDVSLDQLYQIFKRYNTGSVALNAAEIRNAVYQSSPLHELMFRLAGEHRDTSRYLDSHEERVAEDLRQIMRGKALRYGAYDFLGRFFAFKHEDTGSVAKATNSFMHKYANANAETLEKYRQDFIAAFNATVSWYENPLIEPKINGQFHAWLATIQMVASDHCLQLIKSGVTDEPSVAQFIQQNWQAFATDKVLVEKQNSTNFWKLQKLWISEIENNVRLAPAVQAI
jgi:hypothetical protein